MTLAELYQKSEEWKSDTDFEYYYSTGKYHYKTLEILGLSDLTGLKNHLLRLGPKDPLSSHLFETCHSIKEELDEYTFTLNQAYRIQKISESRFDVLTAKLKKIEQQEGSYDEQDLPFYFLRAFYFDNLFPMWQDIQLSSIEHFVHSSRKLSHHKPKEAFVIKNWTTILDTALSHIGYSIRKSHKRDSKDEMRSAYDSYELLSTYLLALKNSLRAGTFRYDELNQINMSLSAGIISTISITNLLMDTEYSEAVFGNTKLSKPLGNSGYDDQLYILDSLTLFHNSFKIHFRFEAYAILRNLTSKELNASSKVIDDERG